MNNKILKILICTLIFFIGISAVNASEFNTTEELMTNESNEVISGSMEDDVLNLDDCLDDLESVSEDDFLKVKTENEQIAFSSEDVLSAENNSNEVLTIENNAVGVLSRSNENKVLSVKVNDSVLTGSSTGKISYPPADDVSGDSVTQEYEHTFFKIKMPKKYWKYMNTNYKKTPKKFKKWFKKTFKKKFNKSLKKLKKKVKVNKKYHWKIYNIKYFKYRIGSRYCLEFYALFHRTYYYDSNLEKFCWK